MFPSRRRWSVGRGGFPHAGGDVSGGASLTRRAFLLSLRRWGCFPDRVLLRHDGGVFPTQVGMFLKVKEEIVASNCYAIARVLHDIAQVFTTN